jgi:hypothetical protein
LRVYGSPLSKLTFSDGQISKIAKNVSGIQMLTRADSMLIPHILRFYDFENTHQIATGRTCEVYKAEYKRKAEVSLKVLSSPQHLDQYKREVNLMM